MSPCPSFFRTAESALRGLEGSKGQDNGGQKASPRPLQALRDALRELRLTLGIALLVGVGLILEGGQSPLQYAGLGVLLVVVSVIGLAVSFQRPKAAHGEAPGSTTWPGKPEGTKSSPLLDPLIGIVRASSLEDLLRDLLKLAFSIVLIIPLILLPLYFFFVTLLHL